MTKHSFFERSQKSSFLQLTVLPALAIIIGLYLSYDAEVTKRAEKKQDVQFALAISLANFRAQITERLVFYSYGLKSLDSLINAVGKENFNYEIMQSFAHRREFQSEFPGVRGVGFIQHVQSTELDSFIAAQRADRPDGIFNVTHLSDNISHLFIIRDILPEDRNASAIGLNIGSEKSRRTAAIQSVARNAVSITSPITLVQANKSIKQGFLILLPFFADDLAADETNLTLDNTWGWTYAPIVIDEVVSSISIGESDLIFSISNVSDTDISTFFTSSTKQTDENAQSYIENVPVFGSEWRFEAHSTPAFVSKITKQRPYTTFFQGALLSLLAAVSLFSVQLVILKRFEKNAHIADLLKAKENTLKEANKELESLVLERTNEIKKSDSFKQAILQSSAYSIIATDENGLITTFNPAAEKLLGYSAEEMIGRETPSKFHLREEIVERAKELSEQMQADIQPGFDVFIYKAKLYGKEESNWTYVHRNGKQFSIRLSVTRLVDENSQIMGYLGIAYDLSEQLANEEIIKLERDRAEKATQAKSQFLANMSHEIRTPINGVQGTLQIIQSKVASTELRSLVDIALRSIKSLSLLLNDILDISKVEAGKIQLLPSPFKLQSLLDDLYFEFKQRADAKGIELHFESSLKQEVWFGDELRIKQILINIISNSVKFTERGTVSISISYDNENGLRFSIIDTGIGMESSTLLVLHNRFEQADQSITRKFGGTGLGMAITKSLVDLMEGKIIVSSEVDVGTKFDVYLPLHPVLSDRCNDETPADMPKTRADLSARSILVAEDNEINQIIIQTILSEIGAQVSLVDDGQKAVEMVSNKQFDLILLDIQMPVLDGIQACMQIKNICSQTPIIAVTANVFEEDIEKYKCAGFDGFIGKPFDTDDLLQQVQKFLLQN